ncbi:pyrimidine dimer DNA glycosylase/endonuclease V [Actinomyces polynesiensis]|uniref:pyrimidine dimer DNA glycosylase/endonuclease V n=1 Tax=Actinomyces polynesiensis TaxID=1325934 RepID=UPI000ACC4EAA|nr:pyrimidine dimer DNA glycosylase/endonuclease V [Actinomyces polynesiensis]
MRLWSLHPVYLDGKGLVACWREALLAQAVLAGRTTGYTHHPQLRRFRGTPDPLAAIGAYLEGLAAEATRRGYHFDTSRIIRRSAGGGAGGGTARPVARHGGHHGAAGPRAAPPVGEAASTQPR